MKNYAQCMTDEELVRELKSRAVDQRTAAEQAVRDDLHGNPSAGSTHEDLAALLDESARRLGRDREAMDIIRKTADRLELMQSAVKENLWKPDPYAGPQGESICGEGVKLEVWAGIESKWAWSISWFNDGVVGLDTCSSKDLAKKAAVARFKTLVGRLQMQYKQASALDDRL